ncbi:hypothetical protein [Actinoplanes sp. NPDC023714]|uniref:hypothetical protein n=1 Tax=Actinoplanes sp. NPDC023714 TaxID=3154322 RepID=UPI0033C4703C
MLAVLLLSLGSNAFGPGIYPVLVGLLIFFVLFQAPAYCGAINRRRGAEVEFCRNNSAGLLLGCRLRQHIERGPRILLAVMTALVMICPAGCVGGAIQVEILQR